MSFFHCRASEDMWTEALKPSLALMMPIDSPRLPVEPTATEYPEKNSAAAGSARTA